MRRSLLLLTFCFLSSFTQTTHATVIDVPDDVPTIQGGINACVNGDTVMIWPGTYNEYEIDFLGKAITVTGTNPWNLAIVEETIVDANDQGRVFYFHSREDSTSILAGLTITNGRGGIQCVNSSPTITNNIITQNWVNGYGGGIYSTSSPIIRNNIISYNTSYANWSPSETKGGGIYCVGSGEIVINNIIIGNESICYGYHEYDNAYGGGIYTSGSTQIINNVIVSNRAYSLTWEAYGGGIYSSNYWDNISNCIIWDNSLEQIYGWGVVSYSDVEGGWGGVGNFSADPLFTTFHGYNYLLKRESPCIDAGNPSIEDGFNWPDWYNNSPRSDMGAYGGPGNVGWLQ